MTKVLLVGDTHFGIRKHSEVYAEYQARFVDWMFDEIKERKIDTVIQLGDLVDSRKYLNSKTLEYITNSWFKRFDQEKINLHQIIGNHDVYFRNTNKVNWINTVLSIFDSEYISHYNDPTSISIKGVECDFIPWINSENEKSIFKFIKKSKSKFLFAHLELSGFLYSKGVVAEHGHKSNLFKHYKKVLTGHYHTSSTKDNILYTGTPYDIDFSDALDKKGIFLLDLSNGDVEFIPFEEKLFFRLEIDKKTDLKSIDYSLYNNKFVKVLLKERPKKSDYDNLLTRLSGSKPFDLSIIDMTSNAEVKDVENVEIEDTLTILKKYVDKNTPKHYSKENVLKHITEIYQEAQLLLKETA